ncbi:MAG: ABC-F family ATP-binding cassette domain-containing protein [Lachnospiraceae bacterium]
MIKIDDLSYSFPQKDLYHKISFTLEDGQHCALIGTSGNGKSTLIDLMMHPEKYLFDGNLDMTPNCRIGYVSQFSQKDTTKEMTVFDYIAEDFITLQNELTLLCTEMETALDVDVLLEKYQQTFDVFHAMDGDHFESNIHKKLNLANLNSHEYRKVSELSGGEWKLVQIIKEMLTSPHLLIMDEPDSYLDFENINALKNLILSHKETLLIITHNRYLLNHCFDKILHLENKELQEFDGNFTDYNLALLEKKIELQELANADTLEIERNNVLIQQLRSNATRIYDVSKGKTLHARVKMQERLEARRIKSPFVDIKQPDIHFAIGNVPEEIIALEVKDYCVSFEEELLENVHFAIKSTDKVALVGPNGTGKTTLLRELFENGHDSIWIHPDMKVAYLSQLPGETLHESSTILDEFLASGFQTNQEVLSYLSGYGFEEETLQQKIGSLSGGEKSLLQLAKIATSKANLLLLDEPASHLDTYSQLALEDAMTEYPGAILMISHDFYSIVNSTDFILLIENKSIRKISTRKFRKIIYDHYFDCDYLEMEQKKKITETKIARALSDTDFELAKTLLKKLKL